MGWLRDIRWILALCGAFALYAAAPAHACSCDGPMRQYTGDEYDKAAVDAFKAKWFVENARRIVSHPRMRVYAGAFTRVELVEPMGPPFADAVDTRAQLRVREVWIGKPAKELTIYGRSDLKSSCGFPVGVGKSGYVFVEEDDRGNLTLASLCAYRILNEALGAHPPQPGAENRLRAVFGVAEPAARIGD